MTGGDWDSRSLWAEPGSFQLTNATHPIVRREHDRWQRERGRRYDEPMTDEERRAFDRMMVERYGQKYPPPGWVEWMLRIWEFVPAG